MFEIASYCFCACLQRTPGNACHVHYLSPVKLKTVANQIFQVVDARTWNDLSNKTIM